MLDGGRWMVDGGRWTVDGGGWTMDDGRWAMDDGRWTMDDGRWTVDGGRWTVDGGRWMAVDGRRISASSGSTCKRRKNSVSGTYLQRREWDKSIRRTAGLRDCLEVTAQLDTSPLAGVRYLTKYAGFTGTYTAACHWQAHDGAAARASNGARLTQLHRYSVLSIRRQVVVWSVVIVFHRSKFRSQ